MVSPSAPPFVPDLLTPFLSRTTSASLRCQLRQAMNGFGGFIIDGDCNKVTLLLLDFPDHVLVPSTLSQLDIQEVPRTLKWLSDLHSVVRAKFLCAVITRARMREGSLVSYERTQRDKLVEFIRQHQPGEGFVLPFMVPESPKIHQLTAEGKAVAVHSPEGRLWFGDIAEEIERRVRQ